MSSEIYKNIILVRHGGLFNPESKVYNRDSVMNEKDRMHLSTDGKIGMEKLAKIISQKVRHYSVIFSSPSIRAIESAQILASALKIQKVIPKEDLDDVLCPWPYKHGMSMKDLEQLHGDIYNLCNETPKQVADRFSKEFWELFNYIAQNETGIIVSHGDPIAWITHKLINNSLPNPKNLRDELYLPKSGAIEFNINKVKTISSWQMLHYVFNKDIY